MQNLRKLNYGPCNPREEVGTNWWPSSFSELLLAPPPPSTENEAGDALTADDNEQYKRKNTAMSLQICAFLDLQVYR